MNKFSKIEKSLGIFMAFVMLFTTFNGFKQVYGDTGTNNNWSVNEKIYRSSSASGGEDLIYSYNSEDSAYNPDSATNPVEIKPEDSLRYHFLISNINPSSASITDTITLSIDSAIYDINVSADGLTSGQLVFAPAYYPSTAFSNYRSTNILTLDNSDLQDNTSIEDNAYIDNTFIDDTTSVDNTTSIEDTTSTDDASTEDNTYVDGTTIDDNSIDDTTSIDTPSTEDNTYIEEVTNTENLDQDTSTLENIVPINPTLGAVTNIKIFTDASFSQGVQRSPGSTVYDYTLHFNQSTGAYNAFSAEVLTNASFDVYFDVVSTITEDTTLIPVILDSETDVTIIVKPDPPEPDPGEDGIPIGTKSIAEVRRDNVLIGRNGNTIVLPGDVIKFNIGLKNTDPDSRAHVTKIYEDVPIALIADDSQNTLSRTDGIGWTLTNPQPPELTAIGTVRYEYEFTPELVLSPNSNWNTTIPFYCIVKDPSVEGLQNWTTDDLTNKVTPDNGFGEGVTGSVKPDFNGTPKYDLALTVSLSGNGQFNFREFRTDTQVQFTIRVTNQGNMPVKDVDISAYIPAGYKIDPSFDYSSKGWSPIEKDYIKGTNANDGIYNGSNNAMWTRELKVYSNLNSNILHVGGSQSYTVNLIAMDSEDPNTALVLPDEIKEEDYYITSEINNFVGIKGEIVTDIDSTPDKNPFNDLYDNRPSNNTLYPINQGGKEKDGVSNQNAKSTSKLQDEDDFDYTYCIPAPHFIHHDEEVITKKRLIDGEHYFFDKYIDTVAIFKEIVGNTNYNNNFRTYTSVPADGKIYNPKSFMIYEIWVNHDGTQYTVTFPDGTSAPAKTSEIYDILPQGLKLISYSDSNTKENNYAIQVNRYFNDIRNEVYDPDNLNTGNYVLDYTNALFFTNKIGFRNNNANNYVGTTDNSSETYGVRLAVSSDDSAFKLEFGNGTAGGDGDYRINYVDSNTGYDVNNPELTNHAMAAYRIRFAVTLDSNNIDYDNIFQNKATYKYWKEEKSTVEDTESFWGLYSSSASMKKYVKPTQYTTNTPVDPSTAIDPVGANVDDWLISGKSNIIDPIGRLVDYKIRFRSSAGFDAGDINVIDKIDNGKGIVDSVDKLTVSAYDDTNDKGYDKYGELIDPVSIGNSAINTSIDSNFDLKIDNNSMAIPGRQQFNITYQVKYNENVKYGENVTNIIGTGETVNSIMPLALTVVKKDINNSTDVLGGYQFDAYYYNSDGTPILDTNGYQVPVKNVDLPTGNPLYFDETVQTDYFIPKGYVSPDSITTSSKLDWTIGLVETKVPTTINGTPIASDELNYNNQLNSVYLIDVHEDKNGNLSMTPNKNQSNINTFTFSTDINTNGNTAEILNRKDENITLTIEKNDFDSKNILTGYEFQAFYGNAEGKLDVNPDGISVSNDPVTDFAGTPIAFTDSMTSGTFVPKDYNTTDKWTIILVETVVPDFNDPNRYQSNLNNVYKFYISKDSVTGNLTMNSGNDSMISLSEGTADNSIYNISYDATISNISDGKAFVQIDKVGADTDLPLKGYEFQAFYGDGEGNSTNVALHDSFDKPVIVNDKNTSFKFTPTVENSIDNGKWEIILIETKAPQYYTDNLGIRFIFEVTADIDGNLTIIPITEEIPEFEQRNAIDLVIKNTRDETATIEIKKVDAKTGATLTGHQFNAYYAGAGNSADINNPVKDLNGNNVEITGGNNKFTFTPSNYDTQTSWTIVLQEVITPVGYESNIFNEYVLNVSKGANGSLTVTAEPNPYVSFTNGNSVVITIGNDNHNPPIDPPKPTAVPSDPTTPTPPVTQTPVVSETPTAPISPTPPQNSFTPTPSEPPTTPTEPNNSTEPSKPTEPNIENYIVEYNEELEKYIVYDPDGTPLGYVEKPEDFLSLDDIIPFGSIEPPSNYKENPKTNDMTDNNISIILLIGTLTIIAIKRKSIMSLYRILKNS